MAIDVCSEVSSAGISPRISFSHDLNQTGDAQDTHCRLDSSLLDPDFDFCFGNKGNFGQEQLSSADELFSNGKILPTQIKKPRILRADAQPNPALNSRAKDEATKKKQLKEFLSTSLDDVDDDEKPAATSKSFWQFRRSNSLNCDSTTRSIGLIRSLQFLSRSNSTGSAPNPPKQSISSKDPHQKRPQLRKQPSVSGRKSSASNLNAFYSYNPSQKSPLRKCGSYGNGVRISPVLNIMPPPYISRGTVNLFGFGSLFCNGKVKKKSR